MIIIFSVEKEKIHSALSMAEERTGEKKISHRCNNSKILQVSFCMTLCVMNVGLFLAANLD